DRFADQWADSRGVLYGDGRWRMADGKGAEVAICHPPSAIVDWHDCRPRGGDPGRAIHACRVAVVRGDRVVDDIRDRYDRLVDLLEKIGHRFVVPARVHEGPHGRVY